MIEIDPRDIYLAEVLRTRRERRLGNGDPGSGAATSNIAYMSRGPRPRQRVRGATVGASPLHPCPSSDSGSSRPFLAHHVEFAPSEFAPSWCKGPLAVLP